MKKHIALLLLISIFVLQVAPTYAYANIVPESSQISDESEIYPDGAPVIGDFVPDPDEAALISKKESLAQAYYDAKMSGDASLASSILSEFGSLKPLPNNSSLSTGNATDDNESESVQISDDSEIYHDGAPVIGDFVPDPDEAALISKKESLAQAYYDAKMSGDSALASSILSEFGSLKPQSNSSSLSTGNASAGTDSTIYYAPYPYGITKPKVMTIFDISFTKPMPWDLARNGFFRF
ncbi:MAG: hypothetical protein LBT59_06740 [Clostridiales bacterium]|jgi:hypothetical protein|nr:hypothetical protein [Clostridiales bacterium]